MRTKRGDVIPVEVIVAVIAGSATVIAAVIGVIGVIISNKHKKGKAQVFLSEEVIIKYLDMQNKLFEILESNSNKAKRNNNSSGGGYNQNAKNNKGDVIQIQINK